MKPVKPAKSVKPPKQKKPPKKKKPVKPVKPGKPGEPARNIHNQLLFECRVDGCRKWMTKANIDIHRQTHPNTSKAATSSLVDNIQTQDAVTKADNALNGDSNTVTAAAFNEDDNRETGAGNGFNEDINPVTETTTIVNDADRPPIESEPDTIP